MVARLDARAETATFLGLLGVTAAIYVAALYLVAHRPPGSSRALAGCLLLALVWRVALMAGAPLVSDDVYRYIWDGRVQQFGHNPYESVPDDPALAHLHTEPTALIDPTSAALPTIYPPAAQLFFRGVTTLHDSVTMMVTAIVLCDLLTALVLWRWLMLQRRNPWWVLAYAWHPLVALEGAGGGHIDFVGTLLIVAAAYALSARRPLVASLALAVAFSVKFLPVVLIPLLWDRVRCRDIVMAVGVVVLLYLPFSDGLRPPVGSLGVYAEQWRFNGPFFAWIELLTGTVGAVVIAVGGGLAVAAVARVRLAGDAPEAWGLADGNDAVPAAHRVSLVSGLVDAVSHDPRHLAPGGVVPRIAGNLRGLGVGARRCRVGLARLGPTVGVWPGRRGGAGRVASGTAAGSSRSGLASYELALMRHFFERETTL